MCKKCIADDPSLSAEEKAQLMEDWDRMENLTNRIGEKLVGLLQTLRNEFAAEEDKPYYTQSLATALSACVGVCLARAPHDVHLDAVLASLKESISVMRRSEKGSPLDLKVIYLPGGGIALALSVAKSASEDSAPDLTIHPPVLH